jgi:hypothetical protein
MNPIGIITTYFLRSISLLSYHITEPLAVTHLTEPEALPLSQLARFF